MDVPFKPYTAVSNPHEERSVFSVLFRLATEVVHECLLERVAI